MIATLTSITAFWLTTIMWMSIIALAICAINAIHGVFIPCCKKGAVSVGLFLALLAIAKTFENDLVAIHRDYPICGSIHLNSDNV